MRRKVFSEQLKGMLSEVALALAIIALGWLVSMLIIKVAGK